MIVHGSLVKHNNNWSDFEMYCVNNCVDDSNSK